MRRGFIAVPAAAVLGLLLAISCGPEGPGFDREELEGAEDRSESLANDLLAFSVAVRDRNLDGIAGYLGEEVDATPIPDPPSLERLTKWILAGSWPIGPETRRISRGELRDELAGWLGRFSEISDARFKVKQAEFESDGAGSAHIKFFLVARDAEGRREWVKGTAAIDVEREVDGPWQLAKLQFETMASKVAEVDLFREVGFSAGVSALFPPFGVGQNQGFVSHGAAAGDVDNDGLIDIAATGVDQNYLYRNRGDGTFADAGESSLVKFAPRGSGAVFLDYDNDGDVDLFFAAVGNQILLENRFVPDGELRFWDRSEEAGVALPAIGFSVVAADVDGNGLTDLYVCSYNRYGTVMPDSWVKAENGTPNLLFLNQGDGTFREAAAEWGVDDSRWSYAAGFVDIDGDADQDLYVANDFGENALYRNDGDRFIDVAAEYGLVDPGFGMGVSFGDYDNDGDLDLHVTNMSSTAGNRILKLLYPEQHEIRRSLSKQAAGNSLYRNAGNGSFEEVTADAGGLSGGWAFGGGFVDFDNDGWEDLYSPNGFISGKSMKDT